MNDENSDDKTEDQPQSLFISDKNENTHTHHNTSAPTQNSPDDVSWNSAVPDDDMVVDYETSSAMDIAETISLNPENVEVHDPQKSSSEFMSKEVLPTQKDSTCQCCAQGVSTEEPKHLCGSYPSLESCQDESVEAPLPFVWKPNDEDLNCTDHPAALELNQTFDVNVGNVNCTFLTQDTVGKSRALHTPGSRPPAGPRIGTESLSCSVHASSHSDNLHAGGLSYERPSFENPQATGSEAQDTTYPALSDVVMQTDVFVSETENQWQYSSGNVTSEYTDGSKQRLVGEKEIQALTPVSDGMGVPSGSVLQEFFCFSNDEPNSETHSESSYGQKEMGQHLRETVSNCLIDDECPLLVPAFDKSKAQGLNPEHKVTVAEDTHIAFNEKDLGTQNCTVELTPSSSPGQKLASSFELTWNANDVVISTDATACMSTPVLEPTNAVFSLSPIEATEKRSRVEKSNGELRNLPHLKGTPVTMSKPNLGKSTTKTNTPIGSKVRKTEIISYPRPNFKNVKAKVMSRPALQSKDPASSKVLPRPSLTSASSPSSVSSSVLSKTPRSELHADTKAEILINKTQKQQFNHLITSQAVRVATHSKNASHKVPRTTSAMKSNRDDVDRASSAHAACKTASVATLFQRIKGIFPVKMESSKCLEMACTSNIDRISPEKKGENGDGMPVEKQELKQQIMDKTFEYGSLFLVSGSFPASGNGGGHGAMH